MPVASVKSLVQAEQVEKRVSSSSSDDDELLLFKPATPQPAHPDTEREEQPAAMEPEPALDVAMKSEPDEMPTPEPDPEPEQREPMLEQLLESQVHPVAVPVPEPVPSPIPEPEQAATSLFAEPTHSAATVLPQRAFSDDGGSSWRPGASMANASTDECALAEMSDSTLVINARSCVGAGAAAVRDCGSGSLHPPRDVAHRMLGWSSDGGEHFGKQCLAGLGIGLSSNLWGWPVSG